MPAVPEKLDQQDGALEQASSGEKKGTFLASDVHILQSFRVIAISRPPSSAKSFFSVLRIDSVHRAASTCGWCEPEPRVEHDECLVETVSEGRKHVPTVGRFPVRDRHPRRRGSGGHPLLSGYESCIV